MRYFVIFLLFFSQLSFAEWKKYVGIEQLLFEGTSNGERSYVVFSEKFPVSGCRGDGAYIRIYSDTKKGEYFISTLLAAVVAEKQVYPSITDCDDWGRPILNGLRIK